MIITTIQQAKKHEDRVNVFVDNKLAFAIGKNQLLSMNLYKGKSISEADLKNFQSQADDEKLRERIYKYLTMRPRSIKETSDYLQYKVGLDEPEAQSQIDYFIGKGLLDDLHFTQWWLENRLQFKRYSLRQIHSELARKGIERNIIATVLKNFPQPLVLEKQYNNINFLLEKYLKKHAQLEERELKQKALQYILNKGYNYEDVKNLLNQRLAVYNQNTENSN